MTFSCGDVRGRRYSHARTFQKRTFPWQGTAIGKERVIVPPFRPISVKADEISFLQTGYKAGRNVLWDEIYGKGENLLAAPMALELDGRKFTVTGSRIVENSPDRVVREVSAEWTQDNYFNEYMGNLCQSRIDKLMYDAKRALDTGDQGLYYDCFFPFSSACFTQGAAYRRPNGSVQWSLSTMRLWREILKRSATLCYLKGKCYNGRPVVELHDTEGSVPILNGWVLTGLSTERGSFGGEFPIRFNESFTLMNIVGGASGKGSRFIVSTKSGDGERRNRELMSLVGYMCAYGLFALEDQGLIGGNERFQKAWNIPFDFGWGEPEVEQFHYWNEEKKMPVAHTGRSVRVSVGKKKDSALVMFGNIGDAEDCTFDLSGLGFGKGASVTDAETGEAFVGNRLSLGRFGYRMLLVLR